MRKQLDLNSASASSKSDISLKPLRVAGRDLEPTPVFEAYWQFAAERQRIFFNRLANRPNPTNDRVLREFKFTNTYRASDRVSQYLIRQVIYREDLPSDPKNLFFRIMLFKLFNKIETWTQLEDALGPPTWENYSYQAYERVLSKRFEAGNRLYSAAYIMPSAGSAYGHPRKHQNHLRLIEFLMQADYPARVAACQSMAEVYALLLEAPSIGPFLAYQYATDLNYSTIHDFPETDFVVAGPGALDGISKCFKSTNGVIAEDVIRYMCAEQERHFSEQEISFPNLWGRPLQLIDCQNIFCEISKYARVAFPEYAGSAGRVRIKQKFSSAGALPPPFYPPKWGINGAAQKESKSVDRLGQQVRSPRTRKPDREVQTPA